MKTRTWSLYFIALCLPINATPLEKPPNCQQALDQILTEQDSLSELKRLRDELEARFKEVCKEDFSAQVEGIANELHRNKAIKVAFAKRRLTKLIDSRSRQFAGSTKHYCLVCQEHLADSGKSPKYCSLCPEWCEKPNTPN